MALRVSQELLDIFYPINSVHIRYDTTDPKTLFGGTWVLCPDDKYLMSSTNDTPGSLIAGSTVTGSTVLSVAQMPSHGHSISWPSGTADIRINSNSIAGSASITIGGLGGTAYGPPSANNTGGNSGHNHTIDPLQLPAINLRVWRRTA